MNTFINFDWSAIRQELEAGGERAQAVRDELGRLNHLFSEHKREQQKAERERIRLARIAELKAAEPNTPVYFTGADTRLIRGAVRCMLKSGDARTNMKVQVQGPDKQWRTWRLPYDQVSLDWRQQTSMVPNIAGIRMIHKVTEQPW